MLGKPNYHFPLNRLESDIPLPGFIEANVGVAGDRPQNGKMGRCYRYANGNVKYVCVVFVALHQICFAVRCIFFTTGLMAGSFWLGSASSTAPGISGTLW